MPRWDGHVVTEDTKQKIGAALDRKIDFTCEGCGIAARKKRYLFLKSKRHFCSRQCQIKFQLQAKPVGEASPHWTGMEAGYNAKHKWISRYAGKATRCSFDPNHAGPRFEWANVSGEYKREISDYMQLCVRCHRKFDSERRKNEPN
jgi:hypothetical protein